MKGAKGVLVLISAAKGSLKLNESKLAMNTIRAFASPDAHVIYGTAYDDSLGDAIRVTVVATGLNRAGARQPLKVIQPEQARRTGTDNMPIVPTLTHAVAEGGLGSVGATGLGAAMGAAQLGGSNHDSLRPAVWRNRTHAAAKVDALSSGGMEDFEIPAFLRKQAD